MSLEEMKVNDRDAQPVPEPSDVPKPTEPNPESKTWQDFAKQFLSNLASWFLKLKIIYKLILLIIAIAILIILLLAYLGVFGQQVADLMKQLVNKIMEMVGSKKS